LTVSLLASKDYVRFRMTPDKQIPVEKDAS
jgi:hypothetical protein